MSFDRQQLILLHKLRRQLDTLSRTAQLSSSTIGEEDDAVLVDDVIGEAATSNDVLPYVQDDVADVSEAASDLQAILQANEDDLSSRFADASVDLQLAQQQLDAAQQKLDDAFIEIGDLDTASQANAEAARAAADAAAAAATAATDASTAASAAQTTADTAKTNADSANQAALSAAGLAASKGEVIRQPSAPTGSRANPANLWINTTADANGNPKNEPNLYNTSTSKWEPITDQKVIDAANAAASAASAAATAQSTADAAKSNAATAQTAAQNAQSTADQAQQTAGTAASNAQAAIVSASAAQTTADQAKTNAAAAQTAADRAAAKAAATASGVLTNGSAEFDFDSWDSSSKGTITVQSTKTRSGSKAWQAGTTGEIRQGMFPVKPGDTWRYRWWAQATNTGTGSVNGGLRLQKYDQNASTPSWSDAGSSTAPTTSVFTMQELNYTVPTSGVTHIRARIAFANAAGVTVYFDDIELVNITDAKAAADAAALAQSTADTAKANAATAASSAATAQQAADAAQSTANTAKTNAAAAQTAADNANTAALNAAGIANGKGKLIVQVSAPSGSNAVAENLWFDISTDSNGKPKNQPNRWNPSTSKWEPITDQKVVDAATAAAAAQSTANNAATAASNAQSAADAAKTAASTAQSTADTAKANAATAQTAANAAQSTADTAKTNAASAQSKADQASTDAATAAGIAGGKADVLYQSTTPGAAYQKATTLWVDTTNNANTPKRWTGSAWEARTDKTATDAAAAAATANTAAGNAKTAADNAATAASNAQQTANNAQTAANQAQATATGKPQILFGTGTPAGTAPYGSTWFRVDASGSVIGQWQQTASSNTGSTWTARQLRTEVIANLDVGKLTAGTASIVDAVIQKIAAQTADIQTANIKNLFVTSGATMAQATIDALFTQVVQAHKITADMIDVTSLNGVTITGAVIRSAESGKRVEIRQREIVLFGDNAAAGTTTGLAIIDAVGDASAQTDPVVWLRFGGTVQAGVSHPASRPGASQPYRSANLDAPTAAFQKLYVDDLRDSSAYNSVTYPEGPNLLPLIAQATSDTGWITLTPQNGWRNQSGTTLRYRVRGGQVYLQGFLSKTNATATVFATLPSNLTPNQTIRLSCTNGTGSNGVWMDIPISPDGSLAANTARDPNFAVSWPTDQ